MVLTSRRATLTTMLFVVAMVSALFGFQGAQGITVSPDLGMRNNTSTQLIETVLMNKTSEIDETLADRNRRLIPYMTFYMPNDFAVNQHYNFIPEQQKQMIAFYQSHQPQQVNVDQSPSQQKQQQQSNRFQVRLPSNKPKYQAIVYGTRHQLGVPGKESPLHQNIPISYKESKLSRPVHQQHSSTPKVTPFAPSNKLPGHFTPIIYVHPTDNINYSRKPQANQGALHQYNEILNEQQNYQHDVQIPVGIYTTPKTQILVSPSPRPLYVNDNSQHLNQQLQPPMQFQEESSPNLTPQQKYVEYLKDQLRYKQQQYYQQQEPVYIVNASPPPPVANNIISYEKPQQIPVNQIMYRPVVGPSGGESVEGSYRQSPPPQQTLPYKHAPSGPPFDYNQNPSPRPSTYNNYPKYVDVIVQEPQQIMNAPPEKPVGFKQAIYVTTPTPIMVSSVSPIYQMEESHRPVEIPKSTQSPRPFEIQVEPLRPVYSPQIKYKPEKRPHYVPSPTPQIYRQHITETTQVPPLTLTTYHPNFASVKPNYNPNYPTARPYKPKISHKYKPILITKPIAQAVTRPKPSPAPIEDSNHYGNITHNSLADILHKLQESNQLPKTFTPENIDNSIRTLIKILNNLKQSQTIVENPPQRHEDDYDEYDDTPLLDPSHPSPNSGRPGIDYPAFSEIPHTSFNCKEQRYKGFFGDPETNCQVWHYCDLNGGQASFLCPNGTIFSQVALTCDWWFNVKCSSTAQLYVLNERLYKYILPLTPKFPEDYSGPLVDKYLALKFKEMEEKMRREKTKGKSKSEEDEETDDDEDDSDDEDEDEENGSSQESGEIVHSTTTRSDEISDNQTQSSQDERSRGPGGGTTTPVIPSLQSMPIVVTSTEEPDLYSPTPNVKTSVESEKVEVIEIKTDGTSGRLIPPRIFNSGLKK